MNAPSRVVDESACADCGASDAKFTFIFTIFHESICEACAPQYHAEDLEEKSTVPHQNTE